MNTNADVIVVGAGISGLTAAWQLHRHGIDVILLEGRSRLGGRILTTSMDAGRFDMGPSWIWPGQPYVAELVKHFQLKVYDQFTEGDLLHQAIDGRIQHDPLNRPMSGALRIVGGNGALIRCLQEDIPSERILLETKVQGVSVNSPDVSPSEDSSSVNKAQRRLTVVVQSSDGEQQMLTADRIAVAIPLRLAAELSYVPSLNADDLSRMRSTPTWMAGHAKFLAVYDSPFWKKHGLSGTALSRRGPLAEIHDASMNDDSSFALFGFFGIDGPTRDTNSAEQLTAAAIQQLTDLFGPDAANPVHTETVDWSREELTAAISDRKSPDHHPRYGIRIMPQGDWQNRLSFIVTETAEINGGLIEGAVSQGWQFAESVIREMGSANKTDTVPTDKDPHWASMSWDWISPDK